MAHFDGLVLANIQNYFGAHNTLKNDEILGGKDQDLLVYR